MMTLRELLRFNIFLHKGRESYWAGESNCLATGLAQLRIRIGATHAANRQHNRDYDLRFSLIRQFRSANRLDGHAIAAPQMLKGVFAESLIVE